MTFREARAFVLLYQACTDSRLRARVARLVPEITEWDGEPTSLKGHWPVCPDHPDECVKTSIRVPYSTDYVLGNRCSRCGWVWVPTT